uniref:Ig-like domain-containing protein n=1 Tax=Myripristis murdjan TaxID=586833 RepID=A0A667WRE4_9TELE
LGVAPSHYRAEKQVYLADGGKLILESPIPAESKPLGSILWKHNRNMVVEWVEKLGSVEYYGAFQGHTTLDRKTARLEIDDLTLIYSGVYSLELNGQLQSETYKVIKVPKPTVALEPQLCSPSSPPCALSCNGEIPEAEPITYSWRRDTGDWTESSKLMNITKDDNHVKNFFCQMKNPVSEEESEPWQNVFYKVTLSWCSLCVCVRARAHICWQTIKNMTTCINEIFLLCACASFQLL